MNDSFEMLEKRYCVEIVVCNISTSVVTDTYQIDVVADNSVQAYAAGLKYCASMTKDMKNIIYYPKAVRLSF